MMATVRATRLLFVAVAVLLPSWAAATTHNPPNDGSGGAAKLIEVATFCSDCAAQPIPYSGTSGCSVPTLCSGVDTPALCQPCDSSNPQSSQSPCAAAIASTCSCDFGSVQALVEAFTGCTDAGSECMCSTEFVNMANAIDTCSMTVPRMYRETMAVCHCDTEAVSGMTQKLNACVSMTAEAERCSGCGAQWLRVDLAARQCDMTVQAAYDFELMCDFAPQLTCDDLGMAFDDVTACVNQQTDSAGVCSCKELAEGTLIPLYDECHTKPDFNYTQAQVSAMNATVSAIYASCDEVYAPNCTETDATDLITRTADFDSCLAENNGRLCPCGHILSEVNALSVECEGYEYMDEAFMADCTDTHHFMMCSATSMLADGVVECVTDALSNNTNTSSGSASATQGATNTSQPECRCYLQAMSAKPLFDACNASLTAAQEAVIMPMVRACEDRSPGMLCPTPALDEEVMGAFDDVQTCLNSTDDGACGCLPYIGAANRVAAQCDMTYMDNATVTELRASCQQMECAERAAKAAAQYHQCSEDSTANACTCLPALEDMVAASNECGAGSTESTESLAALQAMCASCDVAAIEAARKPAFECLHTHQDCSCVELVETAITAVGSCTLYGTTELQAFLMQCQDHDGSTMSELCSMCDVWPWPGSCEDKLKSLCQGSQPEPFCSMCSGPVLSPHDDCFKAFHNSCSKLIEVATFCSDCAAQPIPYSGTSGCSVPTLCTGVDKPALCQPCGSSNPQSSQSPCASAIASTCSCNFGSLQVTVQAFTSCADAGSECMCSTEFDNMANAIDTCGMAVPRVYRETMAACHCDAEAVSGMTQKLNACVSMTPEAERCSGCGAQWLRVDLAARQCDMTVQAAYDFELMCDFAPQLTCDDLGLAADDVTACVNQQTDAAGVCSCRELAEDTLIPLYDECHTKPDFNYTQAQVSAMNATVSAIYASCDEVYAPNCTETDATDLITRTADFDSCLAENNGRLCPCGHILSEVNALSVECEGYEYMDEAFMADCTDTHHFMMCSATSMLADGVVECVTDALSNNTSTSSGSASATQGATNTSQPECRCYLQAMSAKPLFDACNASLTAAQEAVIMPMVRACEDRSPGMLCPTPALDEEVMSAFDDVQTCLNSTDDGACGCLPYIGAANRVAAQCDMTYMDNATVTELRASCQHMECAERAAKAAAQYHQCSEDSTANACTCLPALEDMTAAVARCGAGSTGSTESLAALQAMCASCDVAAIEAARKPAFECLHTVQDCRCVELIEAAITASASCPLYGTSELQGFLVQCQDDDGPTMSELCSLCDVWPWPGSCEDKLKRLCQGSQPEPFCSMCSGPVLSEHDECFQAFHDSCSMCDETALYQSARGMQICLANNDSPCMCGEWFGEYVQETQRCDVTPNATAVALMEPCVATCNGTALYDSAAALKDCLSDKSVCLCAPEYEDLVGAAGACTGSAVLQNFHFPADRKALELVFADCEAGTGTGSTSCSVSFVNQLVVNVQSCVLGGSLCECKALGEALDQVVEDCHLPHSTAVWDFSSCQATSGHKPLSPVAPYASGCQACMTGDSSGCATKMEAFCVAASQYGVTTDFCGACSAGPGSMDCVQAIGHACSTCHWSAYMSSRDDLEACLSNGPVCDCLYQYEDFEYYSTECQMPMAQWTGRLADAASDGCSSTDCDLTKAEAAYNSVVDCTRNHQLCDCSMELEEAQGAAGDCGVPLRMPQAALFYDTCSLADGCAMVGPALDDYLNCANGTATSDDLCTCTPELHAVIDVAHSCSFFEVPEEVKHMAAYLDAACDGDRLRCSPMRFNQTMHTLGQCLDGKLVSADGTTVPLCACDAIYSNATAMVNKCDDVWSTQPFFHEMQASLNQLDTLFSTVCHDSDDACSVVRLGVAQQAFYTCMQLKAQCSCMPEFDTMLAELRLCNDTDATSVEGSMDACISEENHIGDVCSQCVVLVGRPPQCEAWTASMCSAPDAPNACTVCQQFGQGIECFGAVLDTCNACNWPAYLTTKAAYMGCEQTAGDVCDCEPQWADYKDWFESCSLMEAPATFKHALDHCNAGPIGPCVEGVAFAGDALFSCLNAKPLCECKQAYFDYEGIMTTCNQTVPATLSSDFASVCNTGQCPPGKYHDAITATEMCITSNPVCDCLGKYDSLLTAASACLKEVPSYVHDVFSACDTSDPTCDLTLVEDLTFEAWNCVNHGVACLCEDIAKDLGAQLELCDQTPQQDLVDIIKQSCGQDVDIPDGARGSVCRKCPTLTSLGTDATCKQEVQAWCSGDTTHAMCQACLPTPSTSCRASFDSLCDDCDWAGWHEQTGLVDSCLSTSSPCSCAAEIEAVSTYGSNCPSPPDFMLNQVKECATAASCNTTRLNIQLTRLKKCQDMRPTCRCLEPYSDYTATLDSCGKEPSAALADQFSGCTDGVRCVDSVANAYTAVVTCEQRQSDACDCLPKFTEYAELSSACFNATSADDPLAMFYDHCTADQDSQPSFVDFTTASFLAKEVDGEAKVVLRRFGGKGPKAMVASEAVLAVYSVDGAFTGVTTAVSWDEGEVNEQVVMLDIDDESLLYGLTKFKVEIVEVKGMLFGESSSAVVVVEPKPVPKVISVFYPSPGVEWSANTTRYVAYAATGFASGTMFSVDVYRSGTKVTHIGVGASQQRMDISLPADMPAATNYEIVVSQANTPAGVPPRQASSGTFTVRASVPAAVQPFVRINVPAATGAARVAWLGKDFTYKLKFQAERSDDEVAVVVVDEDGDIIEMVGRWLASDAPTTVTVLVPRDFPTSATPAYRLTAYLLTSNDFFEHSSELFAVQPPVELVLSAWGSCSETCGEGTRERTASCVRVYDGSNAQVALGTCAFFHDIPDTTDECFEKPCQTYGWKLGSWGTCSRTCGSGLQERTVQCVDQDNNVVLNGNCVTPTSPQPPAQQACPGLKPCETFKWVASRWLECSVKCGGGNQVRIVACIGDQGTISATGAQCNAADMPAPRQACNPQACAQYQWVPLPWAAKCSVECGGGTQTRTVACVETVSSTVAPGQCDAADKPVTERECNTAKCPSNQYAWKFGSWTTCNRACGGGNRTRTAVCVDSLQAPVSDALCVAAGLAKHTRVWCNTDPCDKCAAVPCQNGATCADGKCSCTTGFKGDLCLTPDTCAGVLDKNAQCCVSGVVSARVGDCCVASGAATPVLDLKGRCCASGVLDKCRVCDGTGIGRDRAGACCSGADAALDGARNCCTKDRIDACGVCDGDGLSCRLKFRLRRLRKPQNFTIAELLVEGSFARLKFLQQVYPRMIARILKIAARRVVTKSLKEITVRRRLSDGDEGVARFLASGGIEVETEIDPDPTDDSTETPDSMLDSLYSESSSPDSEVASVGAYTTTGVCGNDRCEEGEVCESADDATCCKQDCPFEIVECPKPAGSDLECGGHGVCETNAVAQSSTCSCFSDEGYTGVDCSECLYPYMSDGNGGCFNAQPAALSAEPSTTGSGTTGSGTTGSGTTGSGTTGSGTTGSGTTGSGTTSGTSGTSTGTTGSGTTGGTTGSTSGGTTTSGTVTNKSSGDGFPMWIVAAAGGGVVITLIVAGVAYATMCRNTRAPQRRGRGSRSSRNTNAHVELGEFDDHSTADDSTVRFSNVNPLNAGGSQLPRPSASAPAQTRDGKVVVGRPMMMYRKN